jgi:hypothetical protein
MVDKDYQENYPSFASKKKRMSIFGLTENELFEFDSNIACEI